MSALPKYLVVDVPLIIMLLVPLLATASLAKTSKNKCLSTDIPVSPLIAFHALNSVWNQ